jgi:hypothetical protein
METIGNLDWILMVLDVWYSAPHLSNQLSVFTSWLTKNGLVQFLAFFTRLLIET